MARRRPLTSPALLSLPSNHPSGERREKDVASSLSPLSPRPGGWRDGREGVGGVRASLHRLGGREHRVRELLEDRDVRDLQLAVAADLDAVRGEHDVAVFLPPLPAPGEWRAV